MTDEEEPTSKRDELVRRLNEVGEYINRKILGLLSDVTNTTNVPLSDVQAVTNTSPSSIRQELRQDEEPVSAFQEQADTFFANLRAEGVDLSAFVSLIPTYERPLNETYRELVILDNDKLKAMSKKKLRRRIRALEAMVLIRDRRLADLEGENDAQA